MVVPYLHDMDPSMHIIVGYDTTVHVPTNVCSLYLRFSTMYSWDCKVAYSLALQLILMTGYKV